MAYDKRRIEKSQYVLGVKPSTLDAPIAAQAGDEPMGICCYGGSLKPKSACASCAAWQASPRATTAVTEALQVCVKALEFRKERSANDEFALNLARIALAESPRATADVERVRPTKELLLEAIDDKVSRAEDLMSDFPPHRAMERWNEANHTLKEIVNELFATTKPGA